MDNALTELLGNEASAGGVLMWIYEILRQPLNEKQRAAAMYRDQLPPIPSTVLYNYSRAQAWYECVAVTSSSSIGSGSAPSTGSAATAERDNSNADGHSEASGPQSMSAEASLSPVSASRPPTSATVNAQCYEYRRKKSSALTTQNIIAAMCPSYHDVCARVQAEESQQTSAAALRARRSGGGNAARLPSSTLSLITNSLPTGELAAQVVRKAPQLHSHEQHSSPHNHKRRGSVDDTLCGSATTTRPGDVTAILHQVMQQAVQTSSNAEAAVEYFDQSELGRLMLHDTVSSGLLQQFFHPPRAHQHDDTFNNVIIANWQPHFCYVSRRRVNIPLGNKRMPSQVRGDTWDPRASEFISAPGGKLQQTICNACNAIAERIFLVCNGVRLRKFSAVFKLNTKGNIVLQWCQAASVVTSPPHISLRDEIVATLPFAKTYTPPQSGISKQPSESSRLSMDASRRGTSSSELGRSLLRPSSAGNGGLKGNLYKKLEVAEAADLASIGRATVAEEEWEMGAGGGEAQSRAHSPTFHTGPAACASQPLSRAQSQTSVGKKKTLLSTWEEVDRLYGPVRARGLLTTRKLQLMRLASLAHKDGGGGTTNTGHSKRGSGEKDRAASPGMAGGKVPSYTAVDVLRSGALEKEKDAAYEAMAPPAWSKRFRRDHHRKVGVGAVSALLQLGGGGRRSGSRPRTAGDEPLDVAGQATAGCSLPSNDSLAGGGANLSPHRARVSRPSSASSLSKVYRDLPLDIISGSPPPSRPHSATLTRNSAAIQKGKTKDEEDGDDEVIFNDTWGAPSQLDNRLLTGAGELGCGPFSRHPLAADAGRLGLGEQYVSTMRPTASAAVHSSKHKYSRVLAPYANPKHSSTDSKGPSVPLAFGATPLKSADVNALRTILLEKKRSRSASATLHRLTTTHM